MPIIEDQPLLDAILEHQKSIAVLVIDEQIDDNHIGVNTANQISVLDFARQNAIPVYFIEYAPEGYGDMEHVPTYERLMENFADPNVIQKKYWNTFAGTTLGEDLKTMELRISS